MPSGSPSVNLGEIIKRFIKKIRSKILFSVSSRKFDLSDRIELFPHILSSFLIFLTLDRLD
jgi:hypothetical protein